jgi:hypothetical protein
MCDKPYTSSDKWTSSVMAGLLFSLVSSPFAYEMTNKATSRLGLKILNGKNPNLIGLLAHSVVYIVILRAMMNKSSGCLKPYTTKDKWIDSFIGGLLFLLISSPFLYETVNSLTSSFGLNIIDSSSTPTLAGVSIHSLVFIIITRILMR